MKRIYSLIFLFISVTAFGQSGFQLYIQSVKQNNLTIKSYYDKAEALKLESKTDLLPSDPVFEYGTFPGNSSAIGTKEVIGISQKFEFPLVYPIKAKVSRLNRNLIENQLNSEVYGILTSAAYLYNELYYLKKANQYWLERYNDIKELYSLYQSRLEKGDASVIEVNKIKIQLLEATKKLRENESLYKQLLSEANNYNGNLVCPEDDIKGYLSFDFESVDSLINSYQLNNLDYAMVKVENQIAQQQIKLTKAAWLPEFELGYESETVLSDTYKGIKIGLSIPLWNDVNKVKAAKIKYNYTKNQLIVVENQVSTEVEILKINLTSQYHLLSF